ncbi:MAG: NAD(P)/FAD-dependent oxidoreductase [Lachnospiraceae bacterium]|nr:NAD(P)/FAD-dependent oxidoreductase [Lachnospiraceae bacterium]
MKKIIIIGGGASGMMCGCLIDAHKADVLLLEKNEKLGKKLFITGKGRGNLTNTADVRTILDSISTNSRFMYSSLYGFDSAAVMAYFEALGLRLKTERGGRVFPQSDHAYEITDCLSRRLKQNKVKILLNTAVKKILVRDGRITGVMSGDGKIDECDCAIVATGGISYPSTGSTGDGYRFAAELGLKVTDTCPSLVPLNADRSICTPLAGVSLKNIRVTITDRNNRKLFEDFGELLFTHNGLSGPVILTATSRLPRNTDFSALTLHLDLKSALDLKQLDDRLIREFKENSNKQFKNSVGSLFVHKMEPLMVELSGIDPHKFCNAISREERHAFAALIKNVEIALKGRGSYDEAVITKGGVDVREVDPKTMESKKVKGLYFIGEVLDVDALTGGFNLQIAWSTAAAAAKAVSGEK